jgi:hypothetical protein
VPALNSSPSWAKDKRLELRDQKLAEHALAHVVADATEAAYRRGDAVERRRQLMDEWSAYAGGSTAGNVVNIKTKTA